MIQKIKLSYPTVSYQYLAENDLIEKIETRLKRKGVEVKTSEADPQEIKKFNSWTPRSKVEEWIRATQTNLNLKFAPATDFDSLPPEETDFMMALYSIHSEELLQSATSKPQKTTGVKVHKSIINR